MYRSLKTALRAVVGETLFQVLKFNLDAMRYDWFRRLVRERARLNIVPTCPDDIDVLRDPRFQASIRECRTFTMCETTRLANLWLLCSTSNPAGTIVDLGAWKGGTTLHLSNAAPDRTVFACDTFKGYDGLALDPALDARFGVQHWATTPRSVERLFAGKARDLRIIEGHFPQADRKGEVRDVSFAHIDLNLYQSCRESMEYLAGRTVERAVFVLDDFHRNADGVVKAAEDFVRAHRDWQIFPLYPGQGLLIHASWFGAMKEASQRITVRLLALLQLCAPALAEVI